MYYYLIIALQAFCVYHCYTNRNNYYWFFVIIFLPVVGCLVYLFTNVVQKRDVEKVQDGLVHAINPTKRIKDLEKKLQFSKTFENQVALADAYLEGNQFDVAIENYKEALKDVFQNDYYVLSKLQEAYYRKGDIETSITYAEKIKHHINFAKSRACFLYGKALAQQGDNEQAETQLRVFDTPYNNYYERVELARFLVSIDKTNNAITIYEELVAESESMSKQSYRLHKGILKKAKEELQTLN